MCISGISGSLCGYKLKAANLPMKIVKWTSIVAGVLVSILAVYLVLEYPKTTYS